MKHWQGARVLRRRNSDVEHGDKVYCENVFHALRIARAKRWVGGKLSCQKFPRATPFYWNSNETSLTAEDSDAGESFNEHLAPGYVEVDS